MLIQFEISDDHITSLIRKCLEDYKVSTPPVQVAASKPIHSIKDLAEFLDCSVVTAQKLKNSGAIRFHQFGRKCIFIPEEVLEDIANKPAKKTASLRQLNPQLRKAN